MSDRAHRIVDVLADAYGPLIERDPDGFRLRFRKMARDSYAFYRGTTPLFYADVAGREDPWADDRTSRCWIHGDLHAENVGSYLDATGRLTFDVNDFDEAHPGHLVWDLWRFAASVGVLGWSKALPDEVITDLIEEYARGYLAQVHDFAETDHDRQWALRLDTARGPILETLHRARLAGRAGLLEELTVVEDAERRFRHEPLSKRRAKAVTAAYEGYLETLPETRYTSLSYALKDVVATGGSGVGSAGLPAYLLLVEGRTEALENDVVLELKLGNVAAPSRVVDDPELTDVFLHHGHRTALAQRALQVHADPWLGWTELDGEGYVVTERSPYEESIDWSALTEPDQLKPVLGDLGRATAKVHCVADTEPEEGGNRDALVDFEVERALLDVVGDREEEFVRGIAEFGLEYGAQVRHDHELFVDAFRAGALSGVGPARQ